MKLGLFQPHTKHPIIPGQKRTYAYNTIQYFTFLLAKYLCDDILRKNILLFQTSNEHCINKQPWLSTTQISNLDCPNTSIIRLLIIRTSLHGTSYTVCYIVWTIIPHTCIGCTWLCFAMKFSDLFYLLYPRKILVHVYQTCLTTFGMKLSDLKLLHTFIGHTWLLLAWNSVI